MGKWKRERRAPGGVSIQNTHAPVPSDPGPPDSVQKGGADGRRLVTRPSARVCGFSLRSGEGHLGTERNQAEMV